MMLRIEKVIGGQNSSDPRLSPDQRPLHACLATSMKLLLPTPAPGDGATSTAAAAISDADSGEIASVGRKNCMVTIDDKCVSRRHAVIELLSNRPRNDVDGATRTSGVVDGSSSKSSSLSSLLDVDDGRVRMEFGAPTTPEEIHACETSPSGIICVIKDMGSKFGTYVSVDEMLLRKFTPGGNIDSQNSSRDDDVEKEDGEETGDDETDDEGMDVKAMDYVELSEKQVRAVRLLHSQTNDSSPGLPKFCKLKEKQSMPLLQLSHYSDSSSSLSSHVTILFGPQGSGIRISLVPLLFTFSRIKLHDDSKTNALLSSLHYIGASHLHQWDVKRSTHLIAKEKIAGAKCIMAWACRRSIVTMAYIEALLKRRDARDDLPREEDFCPPGPWDTSKLMSTSEPSIALREYRFAVMVNDDTAPLAQSAGADILHIHEDAPSSSQAEFESWWTEQLKKASADKQVVVVVNSSSKACKQFSNWLKQCEHVRYTHAKNIAKAITNNHGQGELLKDTNMESIQKIVEDPTASVISVTKPAEDDTIEFISEGNHHDSNLDDEHITEKSVPEKMKRSRRQDEAEALDTRNESVNDEQHLSSRQKRRRRNDFDDDAVDEVDQAASTEPVVTKHSKKVVDESSDDEPGIPTERIPLPSTKDGWLVAAPRRRKAYRKKRDEDAIVDAEVPNSAAETEKVSGLIVRQYTKTTAGQTRIAQKQQGFKRFRKNSVLLGYTSFNPIGRTNEGSGSHLPRIRLVDVLPKESERQRQLQKQQEELEREQELADRLFNDVGVSGGKRGGGSMLDYLSQSTAKKGRGRR